jgi:hypothetical protein
MQPSSKGLTASQCAAFDSDGFLPGPIILSASRLECIRRAVADITGGRSPGRERLLQMRHDRRGPVLRQIHVVGGSRAEDGLSSLVTDPTVVAMACQLMRTTSVRLFVDQIFVKTPLSDGEIPWHQDYSDWMHTAPAKHLTCWIALDDSSISNGGVQYVPGSHRGPLLPKISYRDTMTTAFERLPGDVRRSFRPQPLRVPAGGCVFHHCMTIHGSFGNATPHERRAVAITYMDPETISVSAECPVVPSAASIPVGVPLDGALFPLLRMPA